MSARDAIEGMHVMPREADENPLVGAFTYATMIHVRRDMQKFRDSLGQGPRPWSDVRAAMDRWLDAMGKVMIGSGYHG